MLSMSLRVSSIAQGCSRLLARLRMRLRRTPQRLCPVCDQLVHFRPLDPEYVSQFERANCIHPLESFETLNVVEYSCPSCGASDRDRLYALFFKHSRAQAKSKPARLLDFAPAAALSRFLRSLPQTEYRSADLSSDLADDHVDISDMGVYRDQSFDIFICSHVLEHVRDDRKALAELFRILTPGGWGIVMVPLPLALTATLEDSTHTLEEDRWKFYGQGDHVRMYAKEDFLDRLKSAGFEVAERAVSYFGRNVFEQHGIDPRSVLYVVGKRQ